MNNARMRYTLSSGHEGKLSSHSLASTLEDAFGKLRVGSGATCRASFVSRGWRDCSGFRVHDFLTVLGVRV